MGSQIEQDGEGSGPEASDPADNPSGDDPWAAVERDRTLPRQAAAPPRYPDTFPTPPAAPAPDPEWASVARAAKRFHFPALANGLDFLRSAVELLGREGGPEPRDLKYAVLHLRTAAEVIFKARLEMHDPSLVWVKPSEFDAVKHKAGDFKSCGAEKAIGRMKATAGLTLETVLDPDDKDLAALGQLRNRLTHFGHSDTVGAVQARTLPVLVQLMDFVRLDVLPHVGDVAESWTVEQEMRRISSETRHIAEFVARRLGEIADELAGHEATTVACSSCGQHAVVLGDGGAADLTCLFCGKEYGTGTDAAWEYVGSNRHTSIKDGGGDFPCCTACGESAVVLVRTAAAPDTDSYLCFDCGVAHDGVCDMCQEAGDLAFTGGAFDMCDDCYENSLDKF
ncbi:hypothetical protein ACM614_29025 [Streptomyces sp. 12297]